MDTFDDDQNLETWKPLLTSEEKIGTEATLISTFKPDISYESDTVILDLPTTRIVMDEKILSGAEENLVQPGDDNETEQVGGDTCCQRLYRRGQCPTGSSELSFIGRPLAPIGSRDCLAGFSDTIVAASTCRRVLSCKSFDGGLPGLRP